MTDGGGVAPSLWASLAAIGVGAVLGAWSRYGLAVWLNPISPTLPWGTLAANLIGGFLIGAAIGVLQAMPSLSPLWRLALVTGFLGALTTFSTFSAESLGLIASGQWRAAILHTAVHVAGSLAAAAGGLAVVRAMVRT